MDQVGTRTMQASRRARGGTHLAAGTFRVSSNGRAVGCYPTGPRFEPWTRSTETTSYPRRVSAVRRMSRVAPGNACGETRRPSSPGNNADRSATT